MTTHKLVNGVECPLSEDDVFLIEQMDAEKDQRYWAEIRIQRNALLSACDWTQLPNAPADAAAWEAYRQQLRDITDQPNPFAIVWPVEPS
jgi:hypothetical protein